MKRSIIYVFLVVGLSLLAAGCASRRPLVIKDNPIKTLEEEGIALTVRYLDEETLISKFGKKTNPFLTLYHTMQFKRIVVFEVKVHNQGRETVELVLNRLELHFSGRTAQAYNRFQLANYWEFRDEQAELKSIYKARKKRVIKEWVLPNSISVTVGGKAVGFAVFMGNLPNYGQASVYVPLFRGKEQLVHRFQFTYEF